MQHPGPILPSFDQPNALGTRVGIVSDVRLTRDGLARIVAAAGMEVAWVAATPEVATGAVAARCPDLVIVDLRMPGGLDAVRTLRDAAGATAVVAFAVGPGDREVLACAEAGAAGYVPRDAAPADLVAVMRSVACGEALCSPRVAASLFRRLAALASNARSAPGPSALTARERQIVALLERGMANKEIAAALGIGLTTVKNHVHHILEKLQVRRRGEAAARLRRAPSGPLPR